MMLELFAEAGLRESLFLSSGLCSPKRSTRRTKDIVDVSHKFKIGCSPPKFLESREETDCHRIRQRQKQIDYGKNTIGYERYIALVPREQRKIPDPQTPDVRQLCSKRRWDGLVQQWRRTLHKFDPPEDIEELNNKSFESRSANQYGCYKTEGTGKSTNSCSRRKGTMNLLQKYQKWIASKNSDKNTRH